jgi:hypothetical protein
MFIEFHPLINIYIDGLITNLNKKWTLVTKFNTLST